MRFAASMLGITVIAISAASQAQEFRVTSADVRPGARIANEQVYNGSGCGGANISPEISWSGAPSGTKSFAVLVHEPDAPTGGAGWWHWLVVDIPAGVTRLPKGAGKPDGSRLPAGARQIANDFGDAGWGGPCPPAGDPPHHYTFSVYALKVDKLSLPDHPTAAVAAFTANQNAIAHAGFAAVYGR